MTCSQSCDSGGGQTPKPGCSTGSRLVFTLLSCLVSLHEVCFSILLPYQISSGSGERTSGSLFSVADQSHPLPLLVRLINIPHSLTYMD